MTLLNQRCGHWVAGLLFGLLLCTGSWVRTITIPTRSIPSSPTSA